MILRRNLRPAVNGLIVLRWVVIAALLLVAAHEARADGWYLSPGGVSYHADRQAGYNERNHGLSITYRADDELAYSVGGYGNSIHRRAYFAAARWTPVSVVGNAVRAGVLAGVVSGYDANGGGPIPVALPAIAITAGPVDVTVIGWPSMMGSGAGIAAQFSLRVW